MRHLLTGPTSAGLTNEMVSFYHAGGLRRVGSGGGDEHEQIIVHEPRLDELDAWLAECQATGVGIDPKIFSGLYLIRDSLSPSSVPSKSCARSKRRVRTTCHGCRTTCPAYFVGGSFTSGRVLKRSGRSGL